MNSNDSSSKKVIGFKLQHARAIGNDLPTSTIEHYILQWRIENWSNFPKNEHKSISSPSFHLDSSQTTWYITLYPVFNGSKTTLYLQRFSDDKGPSSVAVTYRFGISDPDERTTWFDERKINNFEKGRVDCINILSLIEKPDILPEGIPSQNDTFILNCEIYILYEIKEETNCLSTADYDLINLSHDFAKLMRSKQSSDYWVKIPHWDITTHKAILAARSPVFQKLIRENMLTTSIALEDSYYNITSLLLFMYTGNFNLVARNGPPDIGFYECAQKFSVLELENLLVPKHLYVRTTMETVELEVTWCIEDFRKQTRNTVSCITSPPFMTCHDKIQWILTLYTRSSSGKPCTLCIFAEAKDEAKVLHSVMKVSLIDKYGSLQKTRTVTQSYEPKARFGFPEYLKNLSIHNRKYNFLQDNALKIHCQLKFVTLQEMYDCHVLFRRSTSTKVSSYLNLSDDLRKFLELGQLTDVMIRTNTSFIAAHWSILFARSKVLASKFLTSNPNVLEISDVDHNTVSAMVYHAYSGSLKQVPIENLAILLSASEKYSFSKLSLVCAQLLGLRNTNNFTEVFDVRKKLKHLAAKSLNFRNSKEIKTLHKLRKLSKKQTYALEANAKWLLEHSVG